MRIHLRIDLPELNRLDPKQRESMLEEAFRSVNASHGRMSNVPHYIGCTLTAVVVLATMMAGFNAFVSVLASVPAYFGTLLVGLLMWRRSMALQLQKVVRQLIAARADV